MYTYAAVKVNVDSEESTRKPFDASDFVRPSSVEGNGTSFAIAIATTSYQAVPATKHIVCRSGPCLTKTNNIPRKSVQL